MTEQQVLPVGIAHACPTCAVEVTDVTARINPRTVGYDHVGSCGHVLPQEIAMRWWADGMRWTVPKIDGASLGAAERRRQITEEGFTPAHDAEHGPQLAWAAFCYLDDATHPDRPAHTPTMWPWGDDAWKPEHSPLRMLIIAEALIAAEIDRRLAEARRADTTHA